MTARYNYCRDFLKWVHRNRALAERECLTYSVDLNRVIEDMRLSVKFSLPNDGWVAPDGSEQIIDRPDAARLPFNSVLLEYKGLPAYPLSPGTLHSSKIIVLAKETEGAVLVQVLWWAGALGSWHITPSCWVPLGSFATFDGKEILAGFTQDAGLPEVTGLPGFNHEIAKENISWDIKVVALFMAALSCSNVETQTVPVPRHRRNKKTPFPYDEYHELVVRQPSGKASGRPVDPGDHRSPREHLRRGHIRRISDEHRVWVNACVVGAGGEGGRISKAYRMTT